MVTRTTDLTYFPPDVDAENSALVARLPVSQLLQVLAIYAKSSKPETFNPQKPASRPFYRDPPAPAYPLSPKAQQSLQLLNDNAWFRAQGRDEKLLNLASLPREPGVFQKPQRPVSKPKDALTLEIENVQRLEDALASAKARLEKKS